MWTGGVGRGDCCICTGGCEGDNDLYAGGGRHEDSCVCTGG